MKGVEFLSKFLFNRMFVLGFSLVFVFSLVRFDAEFLIFCSVVLVIFSAWGFLSDFLANVLYLKMTVYYYYFVRYYQGRLWLTFLLLKHVRVYLFVYKLPYYLEWFKFYEKRFLSLCDNTFFVVCQSWDFYLSYYFYSSIRSIMGYIWYIFYRFYIDVYIALDVVELDSFDNMRKVTEYLLLNKGVFEVD